MAPRQSYHPRWWQIWILPFATPLLLGVVLVGALAIWWTTFGGRQAVDEAGKEVSRGLGTMTYQAMLEGQRIEGVATAASVQLPVFSGSRRVGHTWA